MTRNRLTWLVLGGAALLLAAAPGARKDPYGVFGVIERVVFEPATGEPERVQLWGVFQLARSIEVKDGKLESIDLGRYDPVRKGYLYYTLNPADAAESRAQWLVLKDIAGKGEPVAFGARLPPASSQAMPKEVPELEAWAKQANGYNGRVRPAAEPPTGPDPYPLPMRGRSLQLQLDPGHPAVQALMQAIRGRL
jgi:hypothetical protein